MEKFPVKLRMVDGCVIVSEEVAKLLVQATEKKGKVAVEVVV